MKKIVVLLLLFFISTPLLAKSADEVEINFDGNEYEITVDDYDENSVSVASFFEKIADLQQELTEKIMSYANDIKRGSYSSLWIVLSISVLYGIIHALGPGHSKIIVISYFSMVGKAKWWRGILMGFEIAYIHVLSAVFIVFLMQEIVLNMIVGGNGSDEIKMVKIISYLAMFIIGLFILWQTYRDNHKISLNNAAIDNLKSQSYIGFSAGIVPCTGTLVILFYSMSQEILFLGVIISLAIAFGIAITLSIIGMLSIFMKNKIAYTENGQNRFKKLRYIGPSIIILVSLLLLAFVFI